MRTYTHGIIGYLLYYKRSSEEQLLALIGAMLPDLFLIFGFPFHYFPSNRFFESLHQILHHGILHSLTELFHSFVFVVPLLLLSYLFYKRALPFFVGMLSHGIVDLLTHQRWAYNHFFPFAMQPWQAPVAYTSLWFTILEHTLVLLFALWMLWVYRSRKDLHKKTSTTQRAHKQKAHKQRFH